MLSRTNFMILRDLLGDRLSHINLVNKTSRRRDAWRGYLDGVNDDVLAGLLIRIETDRIGQLFVDGSNYGAAIAAVKRHAPHVRIVTFFHNVEAHFFWGSLRVRRSVKALAVLAANYLAERAAVRWSDVVITLSERDSKGLRRLYGRGADMVAPIVLEDKDAHMPITKPQGDYLLFVGGGFYANIAGIRWFIREIAPRIELPVWIVGRGMEALAAESASHNNIFLVGAVDDLAPVYIQATAVIAPIFGGSGMKTKVAEALMFGKQIVGTPEAFSGYAEDVVNANWCCASADAFVAAIKAIEKARPAIRDHTMRQFYERDHSLEAASIRLAKALNLNSSDQDTKCNVRHLDVMILLTAYSVIHVIREKLYSL